MSNVFQTGRPTNFKLGTQTEHEDSHQGQVPWPPRSQVARSWHIWQVLDDKLRTKRPRNTKIGRKVVHPTGNNAHQIQGQRSRSLGQIVLRPEVCHIFQKGRPTNFKLGIQTEYEDPHQQQVPWPSRSNVKVARSRDAYDRCWPISWEQNVLETPKLVERLSTPGAIMRTSFKVKGQCVISFERECLRTSNLVQRWSTKTHIADKRCDHQVQRSRS